MKKILLILVALLWCNVANSEVTDGDLTWGWSYSEDQSRIKIDLYNANSSKSLKIEKIKVWYGSCASTNTSTDKPDRVYAINKSVDPLSDRKIYLSVNLRSGPMCANLYHDVIEPITYTYKEKKIKNCSKTDYESPCTCENEPNVFRKTYCKTRKNSANKLTRQEAATYCANRASNYRKEIAAEFYKDCMKDEGF